MEGEVLEAFELGALYGEVFGCLVGVFFVCVVSKSIPLDPKTYAKMKVLIPRNMGEITPKNEGHGFPWHPVRHEILTRGELNKRTWLEGAPNDRLEGSPPNNEKPYISCEI